MGVFDTFNTSSTSSSSPTNATITPSAYGDNSAKGVNDIPPPRSDASVNAPPPEQHKRVADFVNESPNARYVFDSRRNGDKAETELCRVTPQGGMSCIKVAVQSAALFKSMQGLGFYCALPAEPTRTHMECNRIPR
ncbi:hypothetical protein CI109_100042 [Kwoniella shandongensis]|uniref:Uncharacterized protein n=1 Tax=Kwoniella shandongensis TaxID=1734106 RepID=A0A5M6BSB1_9TREE|nr:uncharacterized protein CI109_005985 [Kwoniella shandongensis]KAA5525677.1 hypothetical protein CI109_005985 [Kwoniella shandongensis]